MIEKLAKLIYEYAREVKPVDFEFYCEILDILSAEYQLQKYIHQLSLMDKTDTTVSVAYDPIDRTITLDYYNLDVDNPMVEFYARMFKGEEAFAYNNATMVQYMLHTIEHIKQIKLRETATDNLPETELTKICGTHIINRQIEGTSWDYTFKSGIDFRGLEADHDYYIYDPMERLAEIKSYELMVKIINRLKSNYPTLYEFEQTSFVENLISYYPEAWQCLATCPTEVYLEGVGMEKHWKKLGFCSEDNAENIERAIAKFPGDKGLETRLRCGLPIHKDEYTAYLNIVKTSKKYAYTNKKQ